VKRRELLALLRGGAMIAWTFVARAQQRAMPVIGFLNPGPAVPGRSFVAAFREGLSEPAISRDKTLPSNIVERREAITGFQHWLPISLIARSM
jgi:hypothetical protein